MALEAVPDLLTRARQAARGEERPQGWSELSASILSRIRAAGPPAYPIVTVTDGQLTTRDDRGSRTFVSSRVASAAVRRVLQQAATHAPERIHLDVDGAHVTRVDIRLVAAYGADLVALMDQVRQDVAATLSHLLGPDPQLDEVTIDVEVIDVVVGDPNDV